MTNLRDALKEVPILGDIARFLKRSLIFNQFESGNYWDKRYMKGGDSGAGSYDRLAEFKAEIINEFIKNNKVYSVFDFGCGDGNQLKLLNLPNYIGVDVSKYIIQKCKQKFAQDPTKQFYQTSNMPVACKANLCLSLDVIYHLVEDEVFNQYMHKMFDSSDAFVCIYSCNFDDKDNYSRHVRPRKFTKWVEMNRSEFELIKHIPNKYPSPHGKDAQSSFSDFYFYRLNL